MRYEFKGIYKALCLAEDFTYKEILVKGLKSKRLMVVTNIRSRLNEVQNGTFLI